MPNSCKCIIDRMLHKGAMTQEEHDKIIRKLDKTMEWIPCSERLPEEDGNYLVTAMYKGKPDVDMDYWQLGCMWDDWGNDVIAWMPLPKPYKEEKK